MHWKQIVIAAVVLLLAAAAILILRHVAGKREAAENAAPDTATTVQAEVTTAAVKDDAPEQAADETVTFPEFSFTQKGDKVFATVMGGEGESTFDAEAHTVEEILPTAGELIIE